MAFSKNFFVKLIQEQFNLSDMLREYIGEVSDEELKGNDNNHLRTTNRRNGRDKGVSYTTNKRDG